MDENSNDPIRVDARSLDAEKYPDLEGVRSMILREGPKAKTEVSYTRIRDRHTGEHHHDSVSLKTYRTKKGEWKKDPSKSISFDDDGEDEIQKVVDFINANRQGAIPDEDASFLVANASDNDLNIQDFGRFLENLGSNDRLDALLQILDATTGNPEMLSALLTRASEDPKLFAEAAAALNLATYRQAVEALEALISANDVRESEFQELLTENPWMFGSEYSELLDRRNFTRDEEQDFVLRRTSDGFIEVVEIKTTLGGQGLFNYDRSHDCYYPRSEISRVIGQVQHYLEQLDADRPNIVMRDKEDTLKIRAKVIIGRDGNERECTALRRFNGHLHRIEIITFDQLLAIARRVLNYLESATRVARPQ